jgi:NAD(P)-dependent dehydrogenase (short-subunit alcohol dehydrogenase family)
MLLPGSTALITGGAHRLGRQITLALAGAGANVVVHYRDSAAAAAETVRLARAEGVDALALQADASNPAEVERMLESAYRQCGCVDLLVANAGGFRRTPIDSLGEADWDDMMRSSFDTFRIPAQRIGRRMQEQGAGSIIALADVAGIRPWADYVPYSVAKSCVIAYAKALARRLAPAVRVNCIAPGPILFPASYDRDARQREISRTMLKRQGDPHDIGDAVLYLARSDYVTGTVLPVDGGRLLAS